MLVFVRGRRPRRDDRDARLLTRGGSLLEPIRDSALIASPLRLFIEGARASNAPLQAKRLSEVAHAAQRFRVCITKHLLASLGEPSLDPKRSAPHRALGLPHGARARPPRTRHVHRGTARIPHGARPGVRALRLLPLASHRSSMPRVALTLEVVLRQVAPCLARSREVVRLPLAAAQAARDWRVSSVPRMKRGRGGLQQGGAPRSRSVRGRTVRLRWPRSYPKVSRRSNGPRVPGLGLAGRDDASQAPGHQGSSGYSSSSTAACAMFASARAATASKNVRDCESSANRSAHARPSSRSRTSRGGSCPRVRL